MGDHESPAHFIHEIKTKTMTSLALMYFTSHNRSHFKKTDNSIPIPLLKDITRKFSFVSCLLHHMGEKLPLL